MGGFTARVDWYVPWVEAAGGLLLGCLAAAVAVPAWIRERVNMGQLSKAERDAAAVRDATLTDLLAAGWPWDVARVKEVILAAAREQGEVSANSVRKSLEEHLHWLIAPAFNALTYRGGPLVNTGRRVPSTSPATKGHGVSVYRLALAEAGDAA